MDGYEATAKIREIEREKNTKPTPIIALTANAMLSDINDCKNAGMDDYLAKPINYEDLVEKIKHYAPDAKPESKSKQKIDCKGSDCESNLYKNSIIKAIVSELGIDEADAKELLLDFLIDFEKTINEMEEQVEKKDFVSLAQAAHSIKGASGNLRINRIFDYFHLLVLF